MIRGAGLLLGIALGLPAYAQEYPRVWLGANLSIIPPIAGWVDGAFVMQLVTPAQWPE